MKPVLDWLTVRRVFTLFFVVALCSGLVSSRLAKTAFAGLKNDGYFEIARSVAQGDGYRFSQGGHEVFHRPPFYVALLIPGAALPPSFWQVYVCALNAFLFAVCGVATYSLGLRLFHPRAAAAAALLFLANPFILWVMKDPMSAVCQMALYACMMLTGWRFWTEARSREGEVGWPFTLTMAAAFYGGIMCHGTMLAVAALAFSALGAWGIFRRYWNFLGRVFVVGALCGLGMLPWTLRNYKVTGRFVPVAGNSGLAYFAGNAHWGIGGAPRRPGESPQAMALRHAGYDPARQVELTEYFGFRNPAIEAEANSRFTEHARAHPKEFLHKIALNAVEYYWPIIYTFAPPEGERTDSAVRRLQESPTRGFISESVAVSLYYIILVPASILGAFKLLRAKSGREAGALLILAWALFALPYFPFLTFVGHALYTFGTLPPMVLLAANLTRESIQKPPQPTLVSAGL